MGPKKGDKKIRHRQPGGGRKPLGKKKITIKLLPETHRLIIQQAEEAGISRSEFVERTILAVAQRNR